MICLNLCDWSNLYMYVLWNFKKYNYDDYGLYVFVFMGVMGL